MLIRQRVRTLLDCYPADLVADAIVTVLSEKGAPTPVAWTRLRTDRTWDKRLRELVRPAVLILDDFGMCRAL